MTADFNEKGRLLLTLAEDVLQEQNRLHRRLMELESENRAFADRYIQMEQQAGNLANLYVVSHQLHSTLVFEDVLEIVREVVINFIGSECFAILIANDETNDLRTIACEGADVLPGIDLLAVQPGDGPLGRAAAAGECQFLREATADRTPRLDRPLATVPLKIKERVIGLLVIYQLLEQKRTFSENDYELFSLLAGQAATAIFSAKLYTEAERKLNTIQGFLDVLTTAS